MIQYAVTHIEKEVEEDSYENGCIGSRTCVLSERVNIQAPTLPELLKKLGDKYGLNIDDVFIPGGLEEEVTYIGFNRLEDDNGDEPDTLDRRAWEEGHHKLYLADYSFSIEKRETLTIKAEEFQRAGIKTH